MKERHKVGCASYLILLRGNQVLLTRRFNTDFQDGKYGLPSGHIEEGERVSDSLVRETREEVGLELDPKNVEMSHVMHRGKGAHDREYIDFFFVCRNWSGEPEIKEPHKCDHMQWFDLDHLPENTIFYVRRAIEDALRGKVYSEFGW